MGRVLRYMLEMWMLKVILVRSWEEMSNRLLETERKMILTVA